MLLKLSDDVLIKILCYLEPMWMSQLLCCGNNRELYIILKRVIPLLNCPSKKAPYDPGPTFVKYDMGSIIVRPIIHQRVKHIQQSQSLTVANNNEAGFYLGQIVNIVKDDQNSYWKHRYKASRLVGKHGLVVGCTRCFVSIALGNLWSKNVVIVRKRNECVNHGRVHKEH